MSEGVSGAVFGTQAAGSGATITIRPVHSPVEVEEVRALLVEYARSLGFSLCFEGFAAELVGLPGDYAPPGGGLWLARVGDAVAGCVGIRPLAESEATEPTSVPANTATANTAQTAWCEMKRLYVRPAWRGRALGRRLVETALAAARDQGYGGMRLHTLERMSTARALYDRLGFTIDPRVHIHPLAEVRYYEMRFVPDRADIGFEINGRES